MQGPNDKSRSLKPDEELWLKNLFPELTLDKVAVIDDSDNIWKYNCTAWSLGFTNLWFSIPTELKGIEDGYKDVQFVLVEAGSNGADIDIWGQSEANIQHVSRRWEDKWTSKIGHGLCIIHGREELGGDTSPYGKILASFSAKKSLEADSIDVEAASINDFLEWNGVMAELDSEMKDINIPLDVEKQFEAYFSAWKKSWFVGNMKFSSKIGDRVDDDAFQYLLLLNEQISIIPLVIKKLAEPDNFMALVLYERIEKDPGLRVSIIRNTLVNYEELSHSVVKQWVEKQWEDQRH